MDWIYLNKWRTNDSFKVNVFKPITNPENDQTRRTQKPRVPVEFTCLPGFKAAGVSSKVIYEGTHVIVSFTCSPSCMRTCPSSGRGGEFNYRGGLCFACCNTQSKERSHIGENCPKYAGNLPSARIREQEWFPPEHLITSSCEKEWLWAEQRSAGAS